MAKDILKHYGTPRKSGRYPFGSGEDPRAARHLRFLDAYDKLKNEGWNEKEIVERLPKSIKEELKIDNTTGLRTAITWSNKEYKTFQTSQINNLIGKGYTNDQIGKEIGVSEGTVRNIRKNKVSHKETQLESIEKALKEGVERLEYVDVGVGTEHQLGVSRTRFNAVVNKLVKEDGYYIHPVFVRRLADRTKPTTVKVLTKEPDPKVVRSRENFVKIKSLDSVSKDRGETITPLDPPTPVDPKRVKIRYKEEGGEQKDGVIELRPGVPDLDLEKSHYAQVRIKVGDGHYMKGMAIYGDPKDFPKGIDMIYNSKKPLGTDPMKVYKELKKGVDPIEEFGSNIVNQNKSRVLNKMNEEGTWDTWSTDLSSQFLSKQRPELINDRLTATKQALYDEYEEIKSISHPIVKDHLLEKFDQGLSNKARVLDAKGITGTKSHVILPFPNMDPKEVYAPNFKDGQRIVLIRYPHGGVFELPEVTVNNKNAEAKRVMGVAPDAIGIHPSVAQKLSGADFDGDTVWAVPQKSVGPQAILTSRSLPELKNFDPMDFKVDRKTITKKYQQNVMGQASNLITDMTIKGATFPEIARAVKHSMVVIDAEKHNLDYKESARVYDIKGLKETYQKHINPDTGKQSIGASTLISRSKNTLASNPDTPYAEKKNKIDLDDPNFKPEKYSSGTAVEKQYVNYIKDLQILKNTAAKERAQIKPPTYDKEAAKTYKAEADSINKKLIVAKLNAPREREAQILSNKLYYSNITPGQDKSELKKLRARSLARARVEVGSNGRESRVQLTDKEWEAVQSNALSNTKVREIMRYGDTDQIRKLATPRVPKLTPAKAAQAQALLAKGYTYQQVSERMGVTITKSSLEKDLG